MKPKRALYRHQDLKRLFSPQSIAIVGASPNAASYGARTIGVLDAAWRGRLYPVNAKYDKVGERTCYPDIAALPERPDCVVLCVPMEAVEAAVLDCAGQDVGGLVIFASGYAETGRPDRIAMQQRLTELSREHGLRMIGPNCMGYVNFALQAGVTFTRGNIKLDGYRAPGGIGLVSQSGAMGFCQAQGAHRGISMSHVIASGNSCDVDIADTAAYLAEDPACRAIVCIFEGLEDPARLIEAGEIAWANDKPMFICKQGSSETGAQAALSHSGSLTGSLESYQAACERAGIIMLNDIDGLLEAASFFIKAPRRPDGRGVAAVGISGGALVSAADKADAYGIAMPQPSPEVQRRLLERIPEFGAARNPCDVTAMAARDDAMIPDCIEALASDERYGVVVYPQASAIARTPADLASFGAAALKHGKLCATVWLTGWLGGPGMLEAEQHPGVAVFYSYNRAFWTFREWHRREDRRLRLAAEGPRQLRRLSPPDAREKAAALIAAARGRTLTEREAKAVLALYGVPVVGEQRVQSAAEAVTAAQALGMPVAMKVESPDIPHKTEAGVIRLNLKSADEVQAAYDAVLANAKAYKADAKLNGVLVQPMVSAGTEIMVGGKVDPLFGPLIVAGLGGILVELLQDAAVALAPLTRHEARAMLGRLKGQALLKGFRGAAPVDEDRLADIIVRLAEFVADQQDRIAELDVNPLICSGGDILAVDALIVPRPPAPA